MSALELLNKYGLWELFQRAIQMEIEKQPLEAWYADYPKEFETALRNLHIKNKERPQKVPKKV